MSWGSKKKLLLRIGELEAENEKLRNNSEIADESTSSQNFDDEFFQTNEKLLESEKKFNVITEQSLVAIAILCEGKFQYFNKAFQDLLGFTTDEINGWKPLQFSNQIFEDDRGKVLKQMDLKLGTSGDYIENYKFRIIKKTGEVVWVEMFSKPVSYLGKRAILNTMMDITQRVTFQKDLLLFKQLADNSSQGMVIMNREGDIIYANKVVCSYLGISQTENFQGINYITHQKPENATKFKDEILPQILESGNWTGEIDFPDKPSNDAIPTIQSFSLIKDNYNNSYIACIITDISRQKFVETELLKSKQKAEESDKLKSAFLANMSHEIRTPMNGILGFANLLEDKDIEEDLRNDYVSIINENSKTLLNLIDDIIDIAKIEAGELKINFIDCKLNELIHDLRTLFEEIVIEDKKDIELVVSIPEGTELVFETDVFRLRQIYSNLIGNAIKFTEKGYVEFGYEVRDSWIDFFVKDTGVGLKQEQLDVIFDRFRQLELSLSRTYGGTGLGLTITKHLVEILGGKIMVESEYGKGTQFFFSLPYKAIDKNSNGGKEKKKSDAVLLNWEHHTILVAEDEEINFMFIRELLRKTKVQVVHKENGLEAVEYIKSGEPVSLVLMDIKMPVMDGYEATVKIKEINNDIPVVAVTAYAMGDDRTRAMNAGCDDYVTKPVKRTIFFQALKKFLD